MPVTPILRKSDPRNLGLLAGEQSSEGHGQHNPERDADDRQSGTRISRFHGVFLPSRRSSFRTNAKLRAKVLLYTPERNLTLAAGICVPFESLTFFRS